jgi:hypothetical protein
MHHTRSLFQSDLSKSQGFFLSLSKKSGLIFSRVRGSIDRKLDFFLAMDSIKLQSRNRMWHGFNKSKIIRHFFAHLISN